MKVHSWDVDNRLQGYFVGGGCAAAQSCPLCDPMDCSAPGFPVLHCLSGTVLRLMSVESMMTSSHLILCHPLLLLPSILPQHQLMVCFNSPSSVTG